MHVREADVRMKFTTDLVAGRVLPLEDGGFQQYMPPP